MFLFFSRKRLILYQQKRPARLKPGGTLRLVKKVRAGLF